MKKEKKQIGGFYFNDDLLGYLEKAEITDVTFYRYVYNPQNLSEEEIDQIEQRIALYRLEPYVEELRNQLQQIMKNDDLNDISSSEVFVAIDRGMIEKMQTLPFAASDKSQNVGVMDKSMLFENLYNVPATEDPSRESYRWINLENESSLLVQLIKEMKSGSLGLKIISKTPMEKLTVDAEPLTPVELNSPDSFESPKGSYTRIFELISGEQLQYLVRKKIDWRFKSLNILSDGDLWKSYRMSWEIF